MTVQLVPIPSQALVETAPTWLPFIQQIASHSRTNASVMIDQVMTGERHIVLAWDEEQKKAHALLGMHVTLRGDDRIAEVVWLTGVNRELWLHLYEDFTKYVREHLECVGLKVIARPGWTKMLKSQGCKMTHVVFERDI